MKLTDIEIGGRYLAKVSGRLVTVRVTELAEIPTIRQGSFRNQRSKTRIHALNEATGRHYVEIAIMPSLQLQNGFVL